MLPVSWICSKRESVVHRTLDDVIVGFWPWLEVCTIVWWDQI